MRPKDVLQHIKNITGICLSEDGHFSGIYWIGDQRYFNVDIRTRPWDSQVYAMLERIASPEGVVKKVEPNGVTRVAIYF